jgi:sugar phosphate isomerase/epimerase
MWMQKRFARLTDFFEAARRFGFERFELSSVVTPDMVEGFTPGAAEIASVHAPCPSTVGLGDTVGLLLSALDSELRTTAVRMAKAAMEFAVRYGCRMVVLHLGYVGMDHSAGREMRRMFIAARESEPRFAELRRQVEAERAAHAGPHLDAARKSLDELQVHARRLGIRFAFENLPRHWGIPLVSEARTLLSETDPQTVGYWHDTGHAQVQHNLGHVRHSHWLEALHPRLFGMHLHDVMGMQDHLCAGLGEIDWMWIAGYLRPETCRTCEFDYYFEGAHLQEGVEVLRQAGCL